MSSLPDLLSLIQDDSNPVFSNAYGPDPSFRKQYVNLVAKNLNHFYNPDSEDSINYVSGILTIQDAQVAADPGTYGPVLAYLLTRASAVTGATSPFISAYWATEKFDADDNQIEPPSVGKIPLESILNLPLYKAIRGIYETAVQKNTDVIDYIELMKLAGPIIGDAVSGSSDFNSEVIFEDINKVVSDSIIKAGGTVPSGDSSTPPLYDFIDAEPHHHQSAGADMNGEAYPTTMEVLETRWVLAIQETVFPELKIAYGLQPFKPMGFVAPLSTKVEEILKSLGLYQAGGATETERETITTWESAVDANGARTLSDADISTYVSTIRAWHVKLLNAIQSDVETHLLSKMTQGSNMIFSVPPKIPPPYVGPLSIGPGSFKTSTAADNAMSRAILRWCIAVTPVVDIRFGFVQPTIMPAPAD